MPFWHEVIPEQSTIARPSSNHQVYLHVRRSIPYPGMFEVFFRRAIPTDAAGVLFLDSELQEDLWPREPIVASEREEARMQALPLLEKVAAREIDHLFHVGPRPVPIHKKKVLQIDHPTHQLCALVFRHAETRFEVRYFGAIEGDDEEDGWRLAVPKVDDLVVPRYHVVLTLADSLESAEEISLIEMDRLAAEYQPAIKLRQPDSTEGSLRTSS